MNKSIRGLYLHLLKDGFEVLFQTPGFIWLGHLAIPLNTGIEYEKRNKKKAWKLLYGKIDEPRY